MLSFHLPSDFIAGYRNRPVNWGFRDAGGNSLGEITFIRTYSRLMEDPEAVYWTWKTLHNATEEVAQQKRDESQARYDMAASAYTSPPAPGTKERWFEVCERVVNGMFSILKDHCQTNRLPWNENKGRRSAMECYERLFEMKWTPPGRGLWMMGTPFVHERGNSAPLQNCAFVSTSDIDRHHPERPFLFLMEASMLGIGVGFDADGADRGIQIQAPKGMIDFTIPDSREGWVEATGKLLRAFLVPNQPMPKFDYSLVRPAGEPIRGFGGTAAGPGPLIQMHESLRQVFNGRAGETLGSRDIVDIANLIGRCVVAGNVRRSAEIALGHPDDKDFLNLKNYDTNPERREYGWVSNNSLKVEVGQDYDPYIGRIIDNGEPGFVYMDLARKYGRLVDPPNDRDYRAKGFNPCVEQTLESYECCTLVETFPTRCSDKADFLRTLKYAYMYAKAVTLVPTHWPETNAVMQRNRRIGCSASGLAQFVEARGWTELREWLNAGYSEINVERSDGRPAWDPYYSEWLCVRESIKTTSIKPSGSVSLVAGVTPGAHWPTASTYIRRIRLGKDDPIAVEMQKAGYKVEAAYGNEETTVCVEIPVRGVDVRTEREVTIFEKVNLAILAQRYWADNSVSLTLTFDQETEAQHIGTILRMHEGQLKSLSFLPMGNTSYQQMPYEQISDEDYDSYVDGMALRPLDWDTLYANAQEAVGEKFCSTDVCEVRPYTPANSTEGLGGPVREQTGGPRNEATV